MLLSTPTSPKAVEPLNILLQGPPGCGKTTLAMQFPAVCFMDCDRNLSGPEVYNRKLNKELSYAYVPIVTDDSGKTIETSDCFDRLLAEIRKLKNEPSIHTIVVDSLTMVNEFIVQKVLKAQGNKSAMEGRDWGPFKSAFIQLLVGALKGSNKNTICIVHESIITKPDPKNMMVPQVVGYQPSVQGSITDYFGSYFSDVWGCTSEVAPGNRIEFTISTVRTNLRDLKNSRGLPATIVVREGENAWAKIEPYLKGALV